MTNGSATTERIWARVPPNLKIAIEARAEADNQTSPDWIRAVLTSAITQDSGRDERIEAVIQHMAAYLEARFEQLETRIFHENSALLMLGFEIFKEAIHGNIAAMSATTSTTPIDDEGARARHRDVFAEAETHFNRRYDEMFAELKKLRDEAKVKSRALGRPFQATADESGGH